MKRTLILTAVLFFIFGCDLPEQNSPDGEVSDVTVEVHPQVSTVLIVRWKQEAQTDNAWLRFTFENGELFESLKKPGTMGDHKEVILGAPSETDVTFRVVTGSAGEEVESEVYFGTTGSLPSDMPVPTLVSYDPSIASPDRWCLGAVETVRNTSMYYGGEFWVYIMDRQARIVWYFKDPLDLRILFPTISADGTHITYDTNGYAGLERVSSIHRATLDLEYTEEIEMGDMDWDWAEMTDGTILYNSRSFGDMRADLLHLLERSPEGTVREIWNCESWVESLGLEPECYSNTVNLNPARDSVLLSMPYLNTILEIERQSGDIIGQWGDAPGSWDFIPADIGFEFNHYANITGDGTLLVSSHLPGGTEPGEHRMMELEVDEENQTLKEVWTWGEGVDEWPRFSGEATRMAGGNTLVNFGSGGSIYEVTPDKRTAWHVLWDADFPEEENNNLCGHNVMVNDLYALNRGPE